ncbi:hypothetical protein B7C51_20635 [Paenibacillus larvae subsp. pulvifaciens]|uniref:Uncharacterized protein n=1 Tax=Paenibacillus larvae subsp. pulvifaciens TaxID=1477 RepID=A0A1V0UXD2_9BACL|nr:hypothetical protein [Paenibacillus larvae]ARF69728.1 hypothetical protein B7C51_20635 [Paenibacillus larvae subsp. pulvifaciens]
MKKIIASMALVGMLAGSSAAGTIHANPLNQTEKIPVESNHYTSKIVVEDNFTSWESSIFNRLIPETSIINNGTLTLKYPNYELLTEVYTDYVKVEAGKKYKITLKNVEGNVLVAAMGLNYLNEWEDKNNQGNNITHVFTAKESTVAFALRGIPEVSLQGFVVEQID